MLSGLGLIGGLVGYMLGGLGFCVGLGAWFVLSGCLFLPLCVLCYFAKVHFFVTTPMGKWQQDLLATWEYDTFSWKDIKGLGES